MLDEVDDTIVGPSNEEGVLHALNKYAELYGDYPLKFRAMSIK